MLPNLRLLRGMAHDSNGEVPTVNDSLHLQSKLLRWKEKRKPRAQGTQSRLPEIVLSYKDHQFDSIGGQSLL